jgi:hypothetical protein
VHQGTLASLSPCAQPIVVAPTGVPVQEPATSRPSHSYAALNLSLFSPSQLQGLTEAAVLRWGPAWGDKDYLTNGLGIITTPTITVTVDGGYSIKLSPVYPPALPAPQAVEAAPKVGVGRAAVHALWVEKKGELALETPFLAEVVCVVVRKRRPRRLYALAQFHEVRVPA